MTAIPMEHGLILAALLFSLGLIGVIVRRNILFVLMSIEVMMNAAALAFVVAGRTDHVHFDFESGGLRSERRPGDPVPALSSLSHA